MTIIAQSYEVVREIGDNPRAMTYIARGLDGLVVIKKQRFESAADYRAVEFFEREITALSRLDHPGIARFVEPLRIGDDYFRIYEHVGGRSLSELMEQGQVSVTTVTRCAREVLEALEFLHGQSPEILHRDIQPVNIIHRADGSHALVAFGGVKAVDEYVGGTKLVEQSAYAPTEPDKPQTAQSDLYGLGATLAHLVTRTTPAEMAVREGKLDWRAGQEFPEALGALIDKLLEPNPRNRPASATAALEILEPGGRKPPSALAPPKRTQLAPTRPAGRCPRRVAKRVRTSGNGTLEVFLGGTPGAFEWGIGSGLVLLGVIGGILNGTLLGPLIGIGMAAALVHTLGPGGTARERLSIDPARNFVRTWDRGEAGVGRETGVVGSLECDGAIVLRNEAGKPITISAWFDPIEVPWMAWILDQFIETGKLPVIHVE